MGEDASPMRELEFIEWIRTQLKFDPAVVPVGPGDDTAVVMCGSEKLLVTIDQLLDGIHFTLGEDSPKHIGGKAMARSLSDVAAMAALPLGGVVGVMLPKGFSRDQAEAMFTGLRKVAETFRCPIVGGDVATWPGPLAINVTVFARPAGIRPILRSGAKVGDAVCVTGFLGGAWRTNRHLKFVPRIHEARMLASRHELHSMIDISDGLASDLAHICHASGVGAEVFAADVPIHPDARSAPPPMTQLDAALGDGEDYELLFTLPASQADDLLKDQPLTIKVAKVGMITQDKSILLVRPDGQKEPLKVTGWEHKT
jgi:thiamine-monophosphate kinase